MSVYQSSIDWYPAISPGTVTRNDRGVEVGDYFIHPTDGQILILDGWDRNPIWWVWEVLSTGEKKSGYSSAYWLGIS